MCGQLVKLENMTLRACRTATPRQTSLSRLLDLQLHPAIQEHMHACPDISCQASQRPLVCQTPAYSQCRGPSVQQTSGNHGHSRQILHIRQCSASNYQASSSCTISHRCRHHGSWQKGTRVPRLHRLSSRGKPGDLPKAAQPGDRHVAVPLAALHFAICHVPRCTRIDHAMVLLHQVHAFTAV